MLIYQRVYTISKTKCLLQYAGSGGSISRGPKLYRPSLAAIFSDEPMRPKETQSDPWRGVYRRSMVIHGIGKWLKWLWERSLNVICDIAGGPNWSCPLKY